MDEMVEWWPSNYAYKYGYVSGMGPKYVELGVGDSIDQKAHDLSIKICAIRVGLPVNAKWDDIKRARQSNFSLDNDTNDFDMESDLDKYYRTEIAKLIGEKAGDDVTVPKWYRLEEYIDENERMERAAQLRLPQGRDSWWDVRIATAAKYGLGEDATWYDIMLEDTKKRAKELGLPNNATREQVRKKTVTKLGLEPNTPWFVIEHNERELEREERAKKVGLKSQTSWYYILQEEKTRGIIPEEEIEEPTINVLDEEDRINLARKLGVKETESWSKLRTIVEAKEYGIENPTHPRCWENVEDAKKIATARQLGLVDNALASKLEALVKAKELVGVHAQWCDQLSKLIESELGVLDEEKRKTIAEEYGLSKYCIHSDGELYRIAVARRVGMPDDTPWYNLGGLLAEKGEELPFLEIMKELESKIQEKQIPDSALYISAKYAGTIQDDILYSDFERKEEAEYCGLPSDASIEEICRASFEKWGYKYYPQRQRKQELCIAKAIELGLPNPESEKWNLQNLQRVTKARFYGLTDGATWDEIYDAKAMKWFETRGLKKIPKNPKRNKTNELDREWEERTGCKLVNLYTAGKERAVIMRDGKYGVANTNGNIVVECTLDTYAEAFYAVLNENEGRQSILPQTIGKATANATTTAKKIADNVKNFNIRTLRERGKGK